MRLFRFALADDKEASKIVAHVLDVLLDDLQAINLCGQRTGNHPHMRLRGLRQVLGAAGCVIPGNGLVTVAVEKLFALRQSLSMASDYLDCVAIVRQCQQVVLHA